MSSGDKTHVWAGNQIVQHDFLTDCMPGWSLYQGGMGSGKTWAGARKLIILHLFNTDSPGAVVAPTYGDLWRVCVPELIAAAEEAGIKVKSYPNGGGTIRYPHLLIDGRPIMLVSCEEPDRIAGWEVGHLWCDEAARIQSSPDNPRRDAPTQIRGRLRHKKAKSLHALITTTPEGVETWVQRDWWDEPKSNHRYYIGRTRDNPALDPDYAKDLARAIGSDLAEQYLDGRAVSYTRDRAHPTFKEDKHVREVEWQNQETTHVGADFNVSPLCWIVGQEQADGSFAILDELVVEDFALVDTAVRLCDEKQWGHYRDQRGMRLSRPKIEVHADRSSKNRTAVGDPQWEVLNQTARACQWAITGNVFGANPPINARINNVSRLLLDGSGKIRLKIHPRCKRLIEELNRTGRKSSGYDAGSDGKRGHILDALGYLLWDLYGEPGVKLKASGIRL